MPAKRQKSSTLTIQAINKIKTDYNPFDKPLFKIYFYYALNMTEFKSFLKFIYNQNQKLSKPELSINDLNQVLLFLHQKPLTQKEKDFISKKKQKGMSTGRSNLPYPASEFKCGPGETVDLEFDIMIALDKHYNQTTV